MEHVVTASEANQRFSSLLRKVKAGDKIVITSRGEAVAEIVPRSKRKSKQESEDAFAFLESLPTRTFDWTREDAYD